MRLLLWPCCCCLWSTLPSPNTRLGEPEEGPGFLKPESQFPLSVQGRRGGISKPAAMGVGPYWAAGGHLSVVVAWRGYGLWHQPDWDLHPGSSSEWL